jgi:LacI family transcriptional regulator
LLKLGHTRIAFLAGPTASPWAQQRLDGYRHVLREAGLDADDELVFPAGRTVEDGAKAAAQMFNENPSATAIQAVNDLVALGCAQQCLQQGIGIPKDLSLVGFGNLPFGEHFQVPLTTLRQPKHRLGSAAVATMQQLLHGQRPEVKSLPAELIVRASTGPAPASSPFRKRI